ncbi:MAG: hypothetical protein CO156_01265 [Candidatus Pacebacteria bacterium CG_4_9_14_3_um_filter_40_12]|nr:MAG: hypothetical protein COU64_01595 [Candidatus Pacebacteria bacterium CG10_big_fil_rev_8_21_14_0_10_40_26]PIZ79096.1 MAG: hypothetical protein COY01_01570 [Candidatus Pacebacteria bacterium CG_4_10_14_0_2_um_filter_40_20]PJA69216.1 MAG: hypothetical protein CO156_01265 [Candidatus Pacebacteria bacterium CG_4_9_14_3_um_filter_40_12]PJC42062.1 MAG: hypothetical protein CO041_00280 [Candidatus Pacebacteria bacterium CG_4_9_14_0_2_um_filter_40_15]
MYIYDGNQRAQELEKGVQREVKALFEKGVNLTIAAILFTEDSGSRLYTRLKGEAAARSGISYRVYEFSLIDSVETVQAKINQLNGDDSITGIIIQKPWRKTWQKLQGSTASAKEYATWWTSLVSALSVQKDVDGLHPESLAAIKHGNWQDQGRVLPATAQAVLTILDDFSQQNQKPLSSYNISIIGKSDLLGTPLYFELKRRGVMCELLGRTELQEKIEAGAGLTQSDIIVSATGVSGLITEKLLGEGTALIDVGEPQPDVDLESVISSGKVSFITPVPGGVGPLTIVSLLQNAVFLVKHKEL